MSKKFGNVSQEKCFSCAKTVYLLEKLTVEGKTSRIFHNYCFRCAICNCKVTLGNYVGLDDLIYCKTHYMAEINGRKERVDPSTIINRKDNVEKKIQKDVSTASDEDDKKSDNEEKQEERNEQEQDEEVEVEVEVSE
jgi:hypothetical protein